MTTHGPVLMTARWVVGHEGGRHVLYENGEVVFEGGRITFAGHGCDGARRHRRRGDDRGAGADGRADVDQRLRDEHGAVDEHVEAHLQNACVVDPEVVLKGLDCVSRCGGEVPVEVEIPVLVVTESGQRLLELDHVGAIGGTGIERAVGRDLTVEDDHRLLVPGVENPAFLHGRVLGRK